MAKRNVGIVGAGVSGLAACKHVIDKGFDPILFEAEPDIGGVWAHTLESTRLQASADAYRFSDFPWPADLTDGTCPSHDKVLEYIKAYSRQFDLVKCIRFNSRVVGMEYVGVDEEEMAAWETWAGNGKAFNSEKGEWHITVEDLKLGITEVFRMDFVIVCIGLYSGTPNIPDFPTKEGPEIF
ncbi:hypothetical protein LUZ61_020029 [Rhynchospora tenuis]|uniref:Flavin-containing monooxygenase n=1 Tax=Rhynchospora tenuis TaxID=198213 RepID=A0AAD5ZC93_9POAL|nr:hypothetical protein LUZ61_020029 [Rhynchospora tenuis]